MPNKKIKSSSINTFFFRVTLVPFLAALIVIYLINFFINVKQIHDNAVQHVNEIADVMAITASQNPVPRKLMSQQVDEFLAHDPHLINITFHPITQNLPQIKNQSSFILSGHINAQSPVNIKRPQTDQVALVGHISVAYDLGKARNKLLIIALVELLVALAVLIGVYFLIKYYFNERYSSVKQLVDTSEKVLSGDYNIHIDDNIEFETKEIKSFSEALLHTVNKVKLLNIELDDLRKINTSLMHKAQSVSHHQTTFQSMITHELKTPLNAIAGGLQLLHTKHLDASHLDSLGLIDKGYHKLNAMLDNIIELNNLNEGKVEVQKALFNPETAIRNVAQKYSQICLQKGITLSVNVKHAEVKLFGDEEKIETVLNHIINNAVKFTESGSVSLTSNISYVDNERIMWQCEVADTGIGIEEHLHNDIFDAYVQADSGDSREYEGSGLGLTLAKRFADLINATIEFTSAKGEGSTFTFTIQLQDAMQESNSFSLEGYKVMHIHTGKTASFTKVLTELKAQAIAFQDFNMAMTSLSSHKFDLVTLCAMIPEDTAKKIAAFVRNQEEEHRVVIVYHKDPRREYDQMALQAAGIDFLEEYVDKNHFAQQAKMWLED